MYHTRYDYKHMGPVSIVSFSYSPHFTHQGEFPLGQFPLRGPRQYSIGVDTMDTPPYGVGIYTL